MAHPVRGSSRSNESVAPHPQVVLAPLPPRENHQQPVAQYDLYESDYAQSPHPMQPPSGHPGAGGYWPGQQGQHPPPPPRTNTASSMNSLHQEHYDEPPLRAPQALDLDLGALSLDDPASASSDNSDLSSLPLRLAEEPKKPVERTGYVDDTRFSGSDQGHPPVNATSDETEGGAAAASTDSPAEGGAFEAGVVLPASDDSSPQRTNSVDSTHSAVRAYAAANPNAATYSDTPSSHGYGSPHQQGGYNGQEYGGYGPEYGQQRPGYRGPPQGYGGQYQGQDPRYAQQGYPGGPGGYGGNGYQQGYQDVQYDQYGQPYPQDYGQDYYQDPQQQYGGGYPGQGNGYDYNGGYRPQGPGFGSPGYYGGPGGPGGANLQSSPSMRGAPPGRGGPRPPMGPGGPGGPGGYGARPPHRGDSGSSTGGGPPRPAAAAAAPRKRPLTMELLDEMRQRARNSNDPAAQLEYAKALIEAAVTFGNDDPDPKRQKKTKEALFMEGLKIIKRLATTGMGMGKPAYPDAQFFLANCYGNGSLGLQIDHDKAFNLYMQASKQNHPAATYRTAVCHELGAGTKRDHTRAVQFYRKAASLGDTAAMYKLGMVILKGLLGQQASPREAITWLKRAAANADEDNPHALHELGLCFEKSGIPTVIPDETYSRELFTQAAGYGYAPSQFKLGHCYEYGLLTCPVDPRRSIAWYTRAAEQVDAESELGLSGWYLTGSEGVLKQSDTEAYLWARKAADKGLARAEYAVGYYSEVGIGVKQDLEEARRWYLRSAAQGNGRAKKRLTDMKKLGAMRRVRPERGRQAGAGPGPEDENCKVM
ncbi:hypothetical protein BGX30_002445 [Mortierella sp. GBA39]|nr:hypothetical protein BGX30_002445 [Mortierella sp. GBA39]